MVDGVVVDGASCAEARDAYAPPPMASPTRPTNRAFFVAASLLWASRVEATSGHHTTRIYEPDPPRLSAAWEIADLMHSGLRSRTEPTSSLDRA